MNIEEFNRKLLQDYKDYDKKAELVLFLKILNSIENRKFKKEKVNDYISIIGSFESGSNQIKAFIELLKKVKKLKILSENFSHLISIFDHFETFRQYDERFTWKPEGRDFINKEYKFVNNFDYEYSSYDITYKTAAFFQLIDAIEDTNVIQENFSSIIIILEKIKFDSGNLDAFNYLLIKIDGKIISDKLKELILYISQRSDYAQFFYYSTLFQFIKDIEVLKNNFIDFISIINKSKGDLSSKIMNFGVLVDKVCEFGVYNLYEASITEKVHDFLKRAHGWHIAPLIDLIKRNNLLESYFNSLNKKIDEEVKNLNNKNIETFCALISPIKDTPLLNKNYTVIESNFLDIIEYFKDLNPDFFRNGILKKEYYYHQTKYYSFIKFFDAIKDSILIYNNCRILKELLPNILASINYLKERHQKEIDDIKKLIRAELRDPYYDHDCMGDYHNSIEDEKKEIEKLDIKKKLLSRTIEDCNK